MIYSGCSSPFQRGGGEKNQNFMLIRFFKEIDLIGCGGDTQPIRLTGGDPQPIRLQVHAQGLRMQGLRAQGWWGHLANQITQGLHTQGLCAQGLCVQGWWGHLANQITQGCTCRGCACRGCMCRGCTCRGCMHRGCTQGLHTQGVSQLIRLHRGCYCN